MVTEMEKRKNETITHVAIKYRDGRIFSLPEPYRHYHLIEVMAKICNLPQPVKGLQGFLTSEGNFLDRKEAAELVIFTGQVEKLNTPPQLFSEDLW